MARDDTGIDLGYPPVANRAMEFLMNMNQPSRAFVIPALALCLAGLSSLSAQAAEPAYVVRFGGQDVILERDAERIPVRVQMLLSAGEVVTTGEDSFVEVKYLSDGCILKVSNGRRLVVADSSPCAASERVKKVKTEVTAIEPVAAQETDTPAAKDDVIARVTNKTGPLTRANLGEGLVDIKTGAKLKLGDTVFAGQSSSITLYYPKANCEYVVPAENFLEIKEVAPCRKAVVPPEAGSAGAAGADVGLAIGAVAVLGGGAALAVLLLTEEDEDDDKPATPD